MSMALPTSQMTSETSQSDLPQDDSQSLFTREELRQLEADDVEAGRRIGKILASLFVYTHIAMSAATLWTFLSVGHF